MFMHDFQSKTSNFKPHNIIFKSDFSREDIIITRWTLETAQLSIMMKLERHFSPIEVGRLKKPIYNTLSSKHDN